MMLYVQFANFTKLNPVDHAKNEFVVGTTLHGSVRNDTNKKMWNKKLSSIDPVFRYPSCLILADHDSPYSNHATIHSDADIRQNRQTLSSSTAS